MDRMSAIISAVVESAVVASFPRTGRFAARSNLTASALLELLGDPLPSIVSKKIKTIRPRI